MDSQLYDAAVEGDSSYIDDILFAHSETGQEEEEIPNEQYLVAQTTEEGSTILHIATIHHHIDFIRHALERLPALVLLICRNNSKGENPLHIAAHEGFIDVAMVLVNAYKSYQQDIEGAKKRSSLLSLVLAEEGDLGEPWRAKDQHGDTPLHRALRERKVVVSMYLLGEDQGLACLINDSGEGPLYLAAVYGLEEIVEAILASNSEYTLSGPGGWTPLHAAVFGCTSVKPVKLIMEKHPELITQPDGNKEIPLHHAAKTDQEDFVQLLLDKDRYTANLRDAEGLTPLLRAATLGAVKAIQTILRHSPQSIAISNGSGGTVLHLMRPKNYENAAQLLDIPIIRRIINEPDRQGNTPLHLAIQKQDHIMANMLLHTDGLQRNLRNKEGLTAKDLIKSHPEEITNEMAQIGFQLLLSNNRNQISTETEDVDGRSVQGDIPDRSSGETVEKIPTENHYDHERTSPRQDRDIKRSKPQNFNTLAVVASILTAITFASLFAVPGGFKQNGDAVLLSKNLFKVYLMLNASSMCGYILIIFCTLWAMMHDQDEEDRRLLFNFSIHLIQLCFYGTLGAFATGVYATVSGESFWLPIAIVCLSGCVPILTAPNFLLLPLAKLLLGLRTRN